MPTDKIAVSVVLLPPVGITELAIEINRTFPKTAASDYVLNAKTCVPHIGLLMGLIARHQLQATTQRLTSLCESFSRLRLTITGERSASQSDDKLAMLLVERTSELRKLHEAVVDEMGSIFTYADVHRDMFCSPPAVNDVSVSWMKNFAQTSVREKYKPHLSLGIGDTKSLSAPIQFTAAALALCHLGNYCTCRDVLWSGSLV